MAREQREGRETKGSLNQLTSERSNQQIIPKNWFSQRLEHCWNFRKSKKTCLSSCFINLRGANFVETQVRRIFGWLMSLFCTEERKTKRHINRGKRKTTNEHTIKESEKERRMVMKEKQKRKCSSSTLSKQPEEMNVGFLFYLHEHLENQTLQHQYVQSDILPLSCICSNLFGF